MNPIITSIVTGAIVGFIVGAIVSLVHDYYMRKQLNQIRMWNQLKRK
jgi:uncharacterized membrane protein YciS (DUF1049 family)